MTKTTHPGVAGLKAIDALIAKVPGAYAKAHDAVQSAAVAIVEHAMNYGDCSRALTLVRTIPVNQARSLIIYFMTVSPIGVLLSKSKKDDKVRLLQDTSKAYNPFDMDKAKALSWWTMDAEKAEKEAVDIFSGGVFDGVIGLLTKMIENKGGATKNYTAEAIEAATQLKADVIRLRASALAAKDASEAPANDAGNKTDEGASNLPVGKAA